MDTASITLLVVVLFLLFIGGAFRTPAAVVKTIFLTAVGLCVLEAGHLAWQGQNLAALAVFLAPWAVAFLVVRFTPVEICRAFLRHR